MISFFLCLFSCIEASTQKLGWSFSSRSFPYVMADLFWSGWSFFRGCAVRPWSVVTRTRRCFSSYAFACVGYNCFSPVSEDADLSLWRLSVAWKVPGEGACFTRAVSSLRFLPVSAVWVSVCICSVCVSVVVYLYIPACNHSLPVGSCFKPGFLVLWAEIL
jgi:hypothetical protein